LIAPGGEIGAGDDGKCLSKLQLSILGIQS